MILSATVYGYVYLCTQNIHRYVSFTSSAFLCECSTFHVGHFARILCDFLYFFERTGTCALVSSYFICKVCVRMCAYKFMQVHVCE